MSSKLRAFTIAESLRMIRLGCQIKREVDEQLGELILKIAGGDDSVFPALHDRCNVIGRFDIADKIQSLLNG